MINWLTEVNIVVKNKVKTEGMDLSMNHKNNV